MLTVLQTSHHVFFLKMKFCVANTHVQFSCYLSFANLVLMVSNVQAICICLSIKFNRGYYMDVHRYKISLRTIEEYFTFEHIS